MPGGVGGARVSLASTRFGRGVSEKDRKAPRRGPTSADPTGEKARAVKARYVGVCRGCGAYTQPRNGKGDAYAYCKACHPGAIERRWTRERVLDGDARLASPLRPAAVLLRLVAHARAPARGRGARAPGARRVAVGERRHPRSSERGPPHARRPRATTGRRQVAEQRRRRRDWAVTRSHCLNPGNPPLNPRN